MAFWETTSALLVQDRSGLKFVIFATTAVRHLVTADTRLVIPATLPCPLWSSHLRFCCPPSHRSCLLEGKLHHFTWRRNGTERAGGGYLVWVHKTAGNSCVNPIPFLHNLHGRGEKGVFAFWLASLEEEPLASGATMLNVVCNVSILKSLSKVIIELEGRQASPFPKATVVSLWQSSNALLRSQSAFNHRMVGLQARP